MTVFRYNTRATGLGLRKAFQSAKTEGRSLRAIASAGGVSHVTGQKWSKRIDLSDRKSGPSKGHGRIYLHKVARDLIRLFRSHRLTLEEIVAALCFEDLDEEERQGVSEWTVRRFLEESGLNRLPSLDILADEPAKGKGVFQETEPGFVHIDTIFCPQTNCRPRRFLYVAIERTARWLFIEARSDRTALEGALFLENLISACPLKIHTILTDNGVEWKAEFEALIKEQEIKYRHTKPHAPETNGMVERMNGTIKRKTPFKSPEYWLVRPDEEMKPGSAIQGAYPRDTRLERVNKDLKQWTFYWNAVKPHKVLNWQTPIERLKEIYQTRPELFQLAPGQGLPLDLEDWKARIRGHRFIYPPPGIGNRTPS